MIIKGDGNVGIGTTSPGEKLTVSGNISATGTITGSNLSGTNTGDQDLSGYLTIAGKAADSNLLDGIDSTGFLRLYPRLTGNASTILNSGIHIWDVSTASDAPLGAADGLLTTKYWDSTSWAVQSYHDFHSNKLYLKSKQNNTWQSSWSEVWTSTNDGSDSGLDADLLDGLQGIQFLRSDTNDSFTGNLTTGANNHITFGPNSTWGSSLRIGGNGRTATGTEMASIVTTDGNIHLDAADSVNSIYLNYYAGTGGVIFGNGNDGVVARMDASGNLYKATTISNVTSTYWHSSNDGSGSGLDADLLDGQHASAFAPVSHTHTWASIPNNSVNAWGGLRHQTNNGYIDFGPANSSHAHIYTDRPNFYFNKQLLVNNNIVWNAGNDGAGSGLDADLLDGIDSANIVYGSGSRKTNNQDPNTAFNSGFYDIYQTNAPTSTWYSYLTMAHTNASNMHGHQIAGSFYSDGDLFNRHYDGNGSFGNWTRIWNAANDGSGSGLDADLLDGVQGSSYLRSDTSDTFTGTLTMSGSINFGSSNGNINLSRGGFITFYEDGNSSHGIGSRNNSGSEADDIRINSYGAVYINLDSNNNNTSGADFTIGRHGSATGTISELFRVSGETGNVGIGTASPVAKLDVNGSFRGGGIQADSGAMIFTYNEQPVLYGYLGLGSVPASGIFGIANSGIYSDFPSSEVIRIDSSGNVGIGTTSPDGKLHIATSGESKLDIEDTGGQQYRVFVRNSDKVFGIYDVSNPKTWFRYTGNATTSSTKLSLLEGGGSVGIGTTSPGQKLDVAGNIECSSLYLNNASSLYFVPTYFGQRIKANCQGLLVQNGSTYQAVYASAFSVQSDYRLKSNIVPLDNAIDRLKQIPVHRFNWNDKLNEPKVDGFIAHELSEVVPEAVLGEKDAIKEDGTPDYQGIDQSKIVPLLTAALQDAITKIEQLETRIQTLENNG